MGLGTVSHSTLAEGLAFLQPYDEHRSVAPLCSLIVRGLRVPYQQDNRKTDDGFIDPMDSRLNVMGASVEIWAVFPKWTDSESFPVVGLAGLA